MTPEQRNNKYGTTIRISPTLLAFIREHGQWGESADDVLCRVLGLVKQEPKK
jgi:hypothetical protein